MEITKELLEKILNDAITLGTDPKVYTNDPEVIVFLARLGGKIQINGPQVNGRWLTEVRFGDIIFVHSSENQIIPRRPVKVLYYQ